MTRTPSGDAGGRRPAPASSGGPDLSGLGYDPEMLYVECARCGAPILWTPGEATRLMRAAGIDPLELDPFCEIVSEGCLACSRGQEPFLVRVHRPAGFRGTILPRRRRDA